MTSRISLAVAPLALLAACSSSSSTSAPPRSGDPGSDRVVKVEPVRVPSKPTDGAAKPSSPPPPVPPPSSGATDADRDNAVRAAVSSEVEKHFGEIRECYFRGTDRDAKLAGRLTVRFVVAPSGEPVVVNEEGPAFPDKDVASCVLRTFTNMRFSPFEGKAVTIVFPLELTMSK
jgi:hypothetical protein